MEDQTIASYTPAVGDMIREYEILDMIGKGGMATVYKARHTLIKQVVALKIMNQSLTADPIFTERFLHEAQTQAQLTGHQNIVSIHNFFKERGFYIIVIEYIDGIGLEGKNIRTLAEQLKAFGPMDAWHLKPILLQVLSGLNFAHEQGIVHRDIKPSNIMYSSYGVAKIADFGIAQIISEPRLTRTGIAVGTPKYMSPEQVRGRALDIRSDIYSLGITIYEALTGKAPFDGDTDYEIMRKQEEAEPVPLKKINARIPDMWENLVLWCIAKNPNLRPQNYKELMRILEKGSVPEKPVQEKKTVEEEFAEEIPEDLDAMAMPAEPERRRFPLGIVLGVLSVIVIIAIFGILSINKPGQGPGVNLDLKRIMDGTGTVSFPKYQSDRLRTIGKAIANMTYVEDAVIMGETSKLEEIVSQLVKDEPAIACVGFVDSKDRVIASNDAETADAIRASVLPDLDSAKVSEKGDSVRCRFGINVSGKQVGELFLSAALDNSRKSISKKESFAGRYEALGNVIAHMTHIEDAVIMGESMRLGEVIVQLQHDEPAITVVHFADKKGKVIASSDPARMNTLLEPELLSARIDLASPEGDPIRCAFGIEVGGKLVGTLYLCVQTDNGL
jgi:serine/threonine protein kinase